MQILKLPVMSSENGLQHARYPKVAPAPRGFQESEQMSNRHMDVSHLFSLHNPQKPTTHLRRASLLHEPMLVFQLWFLYQALRWSLLHQGVGQSPQYFLRAQMSFTQAL